MKTSLRILRWYKKQGRSLPWRNTRNPYYILVSEIMLQQTQVSRVLSFYRSWVQKFPNWKALADASQEDVLRAWSGLGYNRRALALQSIAQQVCKEGLPESREAWLQLKGIGPYTSSAIALFAQRERVFPVDSVLRRIGGRLFLGKPFADAKDDEQIIKAGNTLLAEIEEYDDVVQAMFDLATAICTKEPACGICPLRTVCKAAPKFLSGKVIIPKRSLAKAKERIHRNKKLPDRIFRGRILKMLTNADTPVLVSALIEGADASYDEVHDHEWFTSMLSRLEKDGFIEQVGGCYRLAGKKI